MKHKLDVFSARNKSPSLSKTPSKRKLSVTLDPPLAKKVCIQP